MNVQLYSLSANQPPMQTKAGERIKSILSNQPLHLMYEESKPSTTTNLNPLLRQKLHGESLAYPAVKGAKCDVVFELEGERIWLETKLIQTHYGGEGDDWRYDRRNPMVKKHLGLTGSAHHSALKDVLQRLPTLDGDNQANRIAFLMVAYFSPRFPIDQKLTDFEREGRLHNWVKETLIEGPDPSPKAQAEGARICVFYWERPTRHGNDNDRTTANSEDG